MVVIVVMIGQISHQSALLASLKQSNSYWICFNILYLFMRVCVCGYTRVGVHVDVRGQSVGAVGHLKGLGREHWSSCLAASAFLEVV